MTSLLLSQPTNTTQIPATDNRSLYYLTNKRDLYSKDLIILPFSV